MTLTEIHTEIERASERRTELYRLLSEGHILAVPWGSVPVPRNWDTRQTSA